MKIQVTGFNIEVSDEGVVSFWIESSDMDNPNTTCEISPDSIPLFIKSLEKARREALEKRGA